MHNVFIVDWIRLVSSNWNELWFEWTVAPKIDRKNLRSVTIKEGEPFSFDVKIIGEPAPDVTWTFAEKMIQQNSTRRIEDVPYNTKFFNDKAERKDTGTYTITAVNKFGQDVAEVEVTVLGKSLYQVSF